MSEAKKIHSSVAVANYFIKKAREQGGLDSLQIMKLLTAT